MDFSLKEALGVAVAVVVGILILFAFSGLVLSLKDNTNNSIVKDSSFDRNDINSTVEGRTVPVFSFTEDAKIPKGFDNPYEYLKSIVKASDTVDGNISNSVEIVSNVDTSKAGVYQVRYTVKNSVGLSTSVVRNIIVE